MKRRKFIQRVASTGIVLPIAFGFPRLRAFGQAPIGSPLAKAMAGENDNIYVIIRLAGGNDGLNMVVPYENDIYYRERFAGSESDLTIAKDQVLKLAGNDTLGLHPSMTGVRDLYNQGKVNIVQNVGYPGQNLSHFRSTDIWLSGSDYDVFDNAGWYAKYLESKYPDYPDVLPDAPFAVEFGNFLSTTLVGEENNMGVAVGDLSYIPGLPGEDDLAATKAGEEEAYVREIIRQSNIFSNAILDAYVAGPDNSGSYTAASSYLGIVLAAVSRMIAGGLGTRVYIVNLGGFDTHTNQLANHANLLGQLSSAIAEFQNDLTTLGLADRVSGGTISEFGRRVKSNGTGTDHGSAAPMIFFGNGVEGGIIGENADLEDLEGAGNIKMEHDFRQLYASILGGWFEATDNEIDPALPREFEQLPIFKNISSVAAQDALAAGFQVGDPVPNPARSTTSIPVAGIRNGMEARLTLYAADGRAVLSRPVTTGAGSVDLDVGTLPNGSYHCALSAGPLRKTTRLVVRR